MEKERKVVDTSIPRSYRMCPGTTTNIAKYRSKKGIFKIINSTVPALSIWNPNINILCGWNDTNCTFTGGTFQIKLLPANEVNQTYASVSLTNVLIQGFKFTSCTFQNVIIKGTEQGTSMSLKSCRFHVSFSDW